MRRRDAVAIGVRLGGVALGTWLLGACGGHETHDRPPTPVRVLAA